VHSDVLVSVRPPVRSLETSFISETRRRNSCDIELRHEIDFRPLLQTMMTSATSDRAVDPERPEASTPPH
jgi:hypothetical protein